MAKKKDKAELKGEEKKSADPSDKPALTSYFDGAFVLSSCVECVSLVLLLIMQLQCWSGTFMQDHALTFNAD